MPATVPVPKGYRIERDEESSALRQEVTFRVIDTDGADSEVTATRAYYDRRWGEWAVAPGQQVSHMESAEARARAAALVLAAEEVARRNGDPNG